MSRPAADGTRFPSEDFAEGPVALKTDFDRTIAGEGLVGAIDVSDAAGYL
jgi:hypothetical protein